MRTLNLGILAHVDAGKTTLTERLLFTAGAIDHVGSVDAGTTQTDSLELERERGITIRSAVASFLVGDLAVNLVDTPGHPDFIAEVERVLGVLDGAVLVVSAVEGVQPQTPLLFRALQRLHVPTLIFVNKIDRAGADPERVLEAMARRLSPGVVPMGAVRGAGTPRRRVRAVRRGRRGPPDRADRGPRRARRGDPAARTSRDEAALSYPRLREQLAAQTRRGLGPPGLLRLGRRAGSAIDALLAGIDELLAGRPRRPRGADVSGRVFKIERTPAGERVAYVRLFAGTLRPRQRVRVGGGEEAKPTSIRVFAPAGAPRRDVARGRRDGDGPRPRRGPGRRRDRRAAAGRGGDGPLPAAGARGRRRRPLRPEQQGSLRAALAQLAEQDPLIDVRQDDHRHEIAVSLYGEVQKEVIRATLERDYGIVADFRETTTVCIERPARVGEAEEVIRAKTKTNITGRSSPLSTNPFTATLALRIEPAPFGLRASSSAPTSSRGSSRSTCSRRPRRSRPRWRRTSTRRCAEGLAGWQVTDCRVTMTDCGYTSPGDVARPTSGG